MGNSCPAWFVFSRHRPLVRSLRTVLSRDSRPDCARTIVTFERSEAAAGERSSGSIGMANDSITSDC